MPAFVPEDPKCSGLRGSCSTGSCGVLEPDLVRLAPVMLPRWRSTLLGFRRELNLHRSWWSNNSAGPGSNGPGLGGQHRDMINVCSQVVHGQHVLRNVLALETCRGGSLGRGADWDSAARVEALELWTLTLPEP